MEKIIQIDKEVVYFFMRYFQSLQDGNIFIGYYESVLYRNDQGVGIKKIKDWDNTLKQDNAKPISLSRMGVVIHSQGKG